jgi:radical SAM superfamily enzyme YgiQ (UPF0313 family)
MSWNIIKKYRSILSSERGATVKNWGGKLPFCLVYPNRYRTAMSNLGFQAVYVLLNAHPDILCERAFLPDPEELREYAKSSSPLLSLESQRPLSEFAVIAFSVSFESDYLNVPKIFRMAGIPPFAAERSDAQPLVIAGGAALFLNPEPVAEFMDLVCIGEAEAFLPELLTLLREKGMERKVLLEHAAQITGIYVPAFFDVTYNGPRVETIRALPGKPSRVARGWAEELDRHITTSAIFTPETEFSDMFLIELSRGCPRGCRFCAAGFIYHPYRQRSLASVKAEVDRGLAMHMKLGFVGAAISDYRGIGELSRYVLKQGGKVSVSSLRIDGLDDDLITVLKASGHKTVTLAPEGGSQRLRDLIKKGLNTEQILSACDRMIKSDILNLKLYFIIGLPTETKTDLEELITLVMEIRERVIAAARPKGHLGEITLSINPFVPKPFTPFQWCAMEDVKSLEGKIRFLQQAIGRLANVRMLSESPRDAYLQALLSRGDRRLAGLLVRAAELGNWRKGAREVGLDTDQLVYRNIPLDETLPWDVIASGDKELLVRENQRALLEPPRS